MDLQIDKDKLEALEHPFEPLKNVVPEEKYVAFIDLLGFSKQVLDKFDETKGIYNQIIDYMQIVDVVKHNVSVQVYSDSILLISSELLPLARIVKKILMITLHNGFLARGGVGFGRHVEVYNGSNCYVISQALVHAVAIEKTIKRPCVALHDSVAIPEKCWKTEDPPITRAILHFDGISLVCPLNVFWGRSAISLTKSLSEQFPDYREKYDWFLSLCEAIMRGDSLSLKV